MDAQIYPFIRLIGLDFLSSMCYYFGVSQFNTFQLEKWAVVHFFI